MSAQKMLSVPLHDLCMLAYALKMANKLESKMEQAIANGKDVGDDPVLSALGTITMQSILQSAMAMVKNMDAEERAIMEASIGKALADEAKKGGFDVSL